MRVLYDPETIWRTVLEPKSAKEWPGDREATHDFAKRLEGVEPSENVIYRPNAKDDQHWWNKVAPMPWADRDPNSPTGRGPPATPDVYFDPLTPSGEAYFRRKFREEGSARVSAIRAGMGLDH